MRKQYTHKPAALRFRRWSRKGYAAFISVQRAVTIGQLSARVSERFQAKNGSIHTSVLTSGKAGEGEAEKGETAGRTACAECVPSLLLLQALCPVQAISRPAASHAPMTRNHFSEIAEGPGCNPRAFRDFRSCKYVTI